MVRQFCVATSMNGLMNNFVNVRYLQIYQTSQAPGRMNAVAWTLHDRGKVLNLKLITTEVSFDSGTFLQRGERCTWLITEMTVYWSGGWFVVLILGWMMTMHDASGVRVGH